jgi:hypothetical protein
LRRRWRSPPEQQPPGARGRAANIIEAADAQGWSLVVLDLGVGLTIAAGRMVAMNLVNFAQVRHGRAT